RQGSIGTRLYGHIQNIELATLCYALEEFTRLKCMPEFETCTSRLQTWNQPRKRKLDPETVYDIDFSRKIYRKQKKKIPNEKLDQKESTGTIIFPIKEHPVSLTQIFNRAERVKRNFIVDEQDKRALLKPTTSPTKAIREILPYNGDYQRTMMKQGLEDEKSITKHYEDKIGCKVNETGFIISRSHPFLGATPDGDVDGGLVEIKRIFSNGLTLCDAVCKRNICKQSSHGLVYHPKAGVIL
ncbi:Transposon Tf2-9 poly, partial [Paramuricea clavata]